jgi:hypothetical protein
MGQKKRHRRHAEQQQRHGEQTADDIALQDQRLISASGRLQQAL